MDVQPDRSTPFPRKALRTFREDARSQSHAIASYANSALQCNEATENFTRSPHGTSRSSSVHCQVGHLCLLFQCRLKTKHTLSACLGCSARARWRMPARCPALASNTCVGCMFVEILDLSGSAQPQRVNHARLSQPGSAQALRSHCSNYETVRLPLPSLVLFR